MMLAQLSDFWLDRHHSDVQIEIIALCEDCSSAADEQHHILSGYARCRVDSSDWCPGCLNCKPASLQNSRYRVLARVPGHIVLLSAASTYFAALLSPTWTQGLPSPGTRKIQVVITDPEDAPAVVALLKCIYFGEVQVTAGDLSEVLNCKQTPVPAGAQALSTTASLCEPIGKHSSCSCTATLASLTCQANLDALCWQELVVRVLRLADQLSVPGVVKAAAGKLSRLFSYQLSWPAVLAVLWLPATLAQQPLLKELRQTAINRVIQDMKHLDPCLASSLGRSVLQHLPPDALATVLGSDQLALVSENSTLAAIDVWLAGPVASSLSLTQGAACHVSDHTAAGRGSDHRDKKQDNTQHQECQQAGVWRALSTSAVVTAHTEQNVHAVAALDAAAAAAEARSLPGQRLAEAVQLLLRQVRLPLCSGAFLAAAVCQRPWLCVGLRGSHELQLMKQYYSCDCQGRYDLAMKLLGSGARCPWSVALRRGLPATFAANTSSIHCSSNSSSKTFTRTGLSQIKAILLNKRPCASAAAADGGGSCSSLNSSSRSSSGSVCDDVLLSAGSSSCSSNEGILSKPPQQAAVRQLWQHVKLSTGTTALTLVIDKKVLGGYLWQMALVAVPTSGSNKSSSSSRSCGLPAVRCMCSSSHDPGGDAAGDDLKQQLCLSVSCKPAWADVLDHDSHDYEAAPVFTMPRGSAAAAVATQMGSQCNAVCGAVVHQAAAAPTTAPAPMGVAATVVDGGSTSSDVSDRCVTCNALWTIAGAKAAEAITRHAPLGSMQQQPAAATDTCVRRWPCMAMDSGAAAEATQKTVSTQLEAAEAADCNMGMASSDNSSEELVHPLSPSASEKSSPGLAHLDVVVGVQLTVCSSEERLRQLVGEGPGSSTNSRQGSLARSHVPCLLEYNPETYTAHALLPVNVKAIDTGSNVLHRKGESGTRVSSGGLEGWQPELWSMLAPTGSLHWHVSLRPLMD